MTMSLRKILLSSACMFGLTPAHAQFTTPNVSTTAGAESTTLNGVTFTNQGLFGTGRLSATTKDFTGDSLGSFSSLAINRDTWRFNGTSYSFSMLALPDRGYNDTSAVPPILSNYAARILSFASIFTPYTGAASLPAATTSQSQVSLTPTGGILLKDNTGQTFTGADPGNGSTTVFGVTVPQVPAGALGAGKISMDSEGLVFRTDGSFYISDEYGPLIYSFDSAGNLKGVLPVPAAISPTVGGAANFTSLTDPTSGRRANQGLEGIAISPDGKKLFALLQSATVQDLIAADQTTRRTTRMLVYDISGSATPSAAMAEYVLQLPTFTNNGTGAAVNRTAAQSEMVALNDTQFLVLARDGNGLGTSTGTIVFKSVMLVDTTGATNILGTAADAVGGKVTDSTGKLLTSISPMQSTQLVNLLNTTQLAKFGLNLNNTTTTQSALTLSEKWEGMALVPTLREGRPNDFFLFVSNDNDFLTTDGKMQGTTYNAGLNNDNMILVYQLTLPTAVDPGFLNSMIQTAPRVLAKLNSIAASPGTVGAASVAGQLAAMRRDASPSWSSGLSFWVGGQLTFGPDVLGVQPGSRDIQSGTFGFDAANGGWRYGFAANVARVDTGGDIQARPTSAFLPMIYGGWFGSAAYIQASMGWTPRFSINGIQRPAAYGLMGTGDTKATSFVTDVEAGYRFTYDRIGVTPFAGLSHVRTRLSGYTETGAAGGNVVYPTQDANNTILRLGVELSTRWADMTPWLRLGWQKSLNGSQKAATVSLAGVQSTMATQSVLVQGFGANNALVGFGLQGSLTQTVGWRIGYEGGIALTGGKSSHSVSAGLRAAF